MEHNANVIDRSPSSIIEINKVLRNTYLLLGMTLVFSGITAYISAAFALPVPRGITGMLIMLAGFYGLLFAIEKTKESGMGLVLTFVFTGFMGYILGPIIGYVSANAPQILMTALGGTGLTFFGLSAYVLLTRKDMSFLSGTLTAGFIVIMLAVVANIFLQIPAFSLAISAAFILFSSMIILWQTSAIIHGGERNYISATVTLFVSIYNIFTSLLHILLAFAGDD
ncbi:Bax inhibitor-1/YccA family protein [Pleionea litopenaei]|uniref:Bax inhibitor-1/YccA family protein n=1 Tax=Pleionea litopenaei TaxID=3070815 RepID=A0AA51RUW9_9GAMM|nr:Bax inhibitor-1/YccA family protein [Pleionea sp. HL-JVS1]WMS88081.1 Bax inhibitor-1/YccA family protein [Pleionea sp. HL-JVS1]